MRPGENQNNRMVVPPPIEEGSLEERPILASEMPVPQTQPVAASAPQTLLHINKWAMLVTGVLLLAIVITGIAMLWSVGFKSNQQARQPASEYEENDLALNSVSPDSLLEVSQAAKLSINGELQVGSAFILTPSNAPSSPKTGQIYYDKTTNTPYVYNGQTFVSMAETPAVQSLGGTTGEISLGNGLQVANGQLSVSAALLQSSGVRVTTIQGQSGDVAFSGGTGIAVNGTTITNTGLIQLSGGNGLLVTQSGGLATVTLPQLLGTSDSPTFSAVQLNSALSIASGGTNTNGGAFTSGGLFYYNGTSFVTTAAPGSNGLCLLSGPSGPVFSSCSGASSGVDSLNGANGTLILDNATANVGTGHITIQDASTSQKGIAQFNSSDFGVASGTVSLDATVTKAGNVFNGSGQLVKLDTGGQSTATGQCLRSTASGAAFTSCPVGGNINSGTSQTAGKLTKFDTTTNQITDSIASESGTTLTVAGTLAASSLQGSGAALTNLDADNISTGTLSVARGGTGQVTFVANSILLGNGTAGLGSLAPGANGDCLVVVGGAPTYTTCTGAGGVSSVNTGTGALTLQGANGVTVSTASGGTITITGPTIGTGVTSLNGLSGALTVADASVAGSVITINTATTSVKGLASFDSTNFVVNSGVVNTIQGIGTTATPTFGGLSLQSATAALSAVGANGTTTLQFATQSGNNTKTITIPNTTGTVAVSATGPLALSASGVLTCATCLTSGGGSSGGVSSVNTLNGDLIIDGANGITVSQSGSTITVTAPSVGVGVTSVNGGTGSLSIANATISSSIITIDNASTGGKGIASFNGSDFSVSSGAVSLITTVTKAGNSFNGANQLLQLNGSGYIPALNGSLLTNLDAGSFATGTLAIARGGTGAVSFTTNGVLYGNGASIASTGVGTTGQCLTATTGSAPSFQACPGAGGVSALNTQTGSVSIQNGSGINVATTTGVITITNTGVTSLQGTTNQITASGSTGSVTLSLPQDINTGAAVQFGSAVLSGASSLTLGQGSSATGSVTFKNGANNFNTVLQAGSPTGNLTFTLPAADGSAGQCLTTNSSGVLSFANCLTGSTGGSGGVSSLQGATGGSAISGAVTVNNAVSSGSSITIDDASVTAKGIASFSNSDFSVSSGAVSLLGTVTKAGNSFNGANQLLQLNGSGFIPALNGSLLTNLDAGNIATGTLAIARGGTGAVSFTTNGVLYGNGTSLASTTAGTTGQCLTATTGSAPSWGSCGSGVTVSGGATDGRLTKFNSSGQILNSSLSESGTTLTYAGNAIINAASGFTGNLLDVQLNGTSRLSVAHGGGVSTNGGTINGLTLASGSLSMVGSSLTVSSSSASLTLNSGGSSGVTLDSASTGGVNIGTSSNQKFITIGNTTGGTGITLQSGSNGITLTGSVSMSGNLTYGGASAGLLVANTSGVVSKLTGTSGDCLLAQGAGVAPIFTTCPSGTSGGWTKSGATIRPTTTSDYVVVGNSITMDTSTAKLQVQDGVHIRASNTSIPALRVHNWATANDMLFLQPTGSSGSANTLTLGSSGHATDLVMNGNISMASTRSIQFSDGSSISSANIVGGWTRSGSILRPTTTSDNVIVGNSATMDSSTAKLQVLDGVHIRINNTGVPALRVFNWATNFEALNLTGSNVSTTPNTLTLGDSTGHATTLVMNGNISMASTRSIQFSDGSSISSANIVGGWTRSGSILRPTTTSDKVLVGTSAILDSSTASLQVLDGIHIRANNTSIPVLRVFNWATANDMLLLQSTGATGTPNTLTLGSSGHATDLVMNGNISMASTRSIQFSDSTSFTSANIAGGWTKSGSIVRPTTTTDKVLVGTSAILDSSTAMLQVLDGIHIRANNTSIPTLRVMNWATGFEILNLTSSSSTGTPNTLVLGNASHSLNMSITGNIAVGSANSYSVGASSGVSRSCAAGSTLNGLVVTGGIVTAGTCTVNGADLAEAYNSSDSLVPGELVMTTTEAATSVKRATTNNAEGLMGIVSTTPSKVMGTEQVPNGYPIALSGRVPTKVNDEGGAINVGDKITISSVPGVGKKASGAGMIVGTAVEAFNGAGIGTIEVFVNLTYYVPSNLDALQAQTATLGDLNVSGTATINNLTVTGLAKVHNLEISGHVITTGGQPSNEPQTAAGGGAVVLIDGNDTLGTITITTGSSPTAGAMAKVVFSELYSKAPRVVLSASDENAAGMRFYKGATTADGFMLNFKDAPAANTTYTFDYFIGE